MNDVQQLETQHSANKELIESREAALRLYKNKDFKKIIVDAFCTKECARYAQASADPSLDAGARADSLALAQAAGHLRRYLSVVVTLGNNAEHQMVDLEGAIDEARAAEDGAE